MWFYLSLELFKIWGHVIRVRDLGHFRSILVLFQAVWHGMPHRLTYDMNMMLCISMTAFLKRYFWKFLEIFRKKEYDGLVVECEVWFRLDVILGLIPPFGVSSKQTQSSTTYANNFKLRPNIYNNSNRTNSFLGWD